MNASFGLAFNLHFVWPPTCDDFLRKLTQVFHRLATRRMSTQLHIREMYDFATCVNLRGDLRIASPNVSSVFANCACIDLRVRLARAITLLSKRVILYKKQGHLNIKCVCFSYFFRAAYNVSPTACWLFILCTFQSIKSTCFDRTLLLQV